MILLNKTEQGQSCKKFTWLNSQQNFDVIHFRYRQCVHQWPVPGPQLWPETADCERGRWPQPRGQDSQDIGGGARQSGTRGSALCHWEVGAGQRPVSPGHALLWLPPVVIGKGWTVEELPAVFKDFLTYEHTKVLMSPEIKWTSLPLPSHLWTAWRRPHPNIKKNITFTPSLSLAPSVLARNLCTAWSRPHQKIKGTN